MALFVGSVSAIVFIVASFTSPTIAVPVTSKLASHISENLIGITANIKSTPPPTPTAKPYPPPGYHCVNLPILMYHHVEPLDKAKAEGHAQLTVDSGTFATQMQYLADRGYTPIQLHDLANYFDSGTPLPKKAVILTFDDAYNDSMTTLSRSSRRIISCLIFLSRLDS